MGVAIAGRPAAMAQLDRHVPNLSRRTRTNQEQIVSSRRDWKCCVAPPVVLGRSIAGRPFAPSKIQVSDEILMLVGATAGRCCSGRTRQNLQRFLTAGFSREPASGAQFRARTGALRSQKGIIIMKIYLLAASAAVAIATPAFAACRRPLCRARRRRHHPAAAPTQ